MQIKLLKDLINDLIKLEAIKYYFFNRILLTACTPITLLLVVINLNPAEQGYYYAFLSILAFQVIAEFGFNAGIMHFISAEWPFLHKKNGLIFGADESLNRFFSLIKIGYKWTFFSAIIAVLILGSIGEFFILPIKDQAVNWLVPWRLSCLALLLVFLSQFLKSICEAMSDVASSQKSSMYGVMLSSFVVWIGLSLGIGLYAIPISITINSLVVLVYLMIRLKPILMQSIFFRINKSKVGWHSEFLPHQYKIGISWVCGFIMFQSFVLFIFKFQGPIEAGKAGVLMQLYSLVNTFGLAWIINAGPRFGEYWAKNEKNKIQKLVFQTIKKALITSIFASIACLSVLVVMKNFWPDIFSRVGSISNFLILSCAAVILQFGNVFTSAVRYQKKEPFLKNSLFGAALILFLNYFLSQEGLLFIFLGFLLAISIVVIPWQYLIYKENINA